MKNVVFGAMVAMLMSGVAAAQTPIVNPTTVQFNASADHSTTLPDGASMVTSYEARFFLVGGASTPVCASNLGKPTPVSSVISMPLPYTCVPLSATARYTTKVAAIGPTGEGVSLDSNPFVRVGPPAGPGTPVVSKP